MTPLAGAAFTFQWMAWTLRFEVEENTLLLDSLTSWKRIRMGGQLSLCISRGTMSLIYILEDDESLREVLNHFLRRHGYDTKSFSSPAEAVSSMRRNLPNALVSDINMPGMSGLEVIENLRENGILIPVVLLSADVSSDKQKRAQELGVKYLFKKPIRDLSRLNEALEDELAHAEGIDEDFEKIVPQGDFFMEISHELRTPLTSLKFVFDGLSMENKGNGEWEKLISIGRKNLERIISLVEKRLQKFNTSMVE